MEGYLILLESPTPKDKYRVFQRERQELSFPLSKPEEEVIYIGKSKTRMWDVTVIKIWFDDSGKDPGWKSKVLFSNKKD